MPGSGIDFTSIGNAVSGIINGGDSTGGGAGGGSASDGGGGDLTGLLVQTGIKVIQAATTTNNVASGTPLTPFMGSDGQWYIIDKSGKKLGPFPSAALAAKWLGVTYTGGSLGLTATDPSSDPSSDPIGDSRHQTVLAAAAAAGKDVSGDGNGRAVRRMHHLPVSDEQVYDAQGNIVYTTPATDPNNTDPTNGGTPATNGTTSKGSLTVGKLNFTTTEIMVGAVALLLWMFFGRKKK